MTLIKSCFKGTAVILDRTAEEEALIRINAKRIVDSPNGFQPRMVMIDKSRAEKRAILEGTYSCRI